MSADTTAAARVSRLMPRRTARRAARRRAATLIYLRIERTAAMILAASSLGTPLPGSS